MEEHVIGVSADWQQCDPQHDDVTDQILFTHSDLWPLSSAYQRPETAGPLSASVSLCLFQDASNMNFNLNWCRSKMHPRWITIFNSACIIWTFEVAVKIVKYKNGIIETVQLDTCRFFCASRWKININTGRNIQIYSHVLFTKT